MKDYKKFYEESYFNRRKKKNGFLRGKRKWKDRNSDILRIVGPTKKDVILELGCAEGKTSQFLAPFVKKVIGVDFSEEALKIAKDNNSKKNITFIYANATNLERFKKEKITKIVAIDFVEHIDDDVLRRFFIECYNLPEECRTISIYTPQRLHWVEIIKHLLNTDPTHIGVRTPDKIIKIAEKAGFEVDLLYFSPNSYPFFRFIDSIFMKTPFINKFFRFRICMRLKKK